MRQVIHKRKESLSFLNLLSTSLYVLSTFLTASVLLSHFSSVWTQFFLFISLPPIHLSSETQGWLWLTRCFKFQWFYEFCWCIFGPTVPASKFFSVPFHITAVCGHKSPLMSKKKYGKKFVLMVLTFRTCRYQSFTMHFNKINNFKSKGTRRITTFRPTTDRIYDCGPIIL
jgi:hypothetical protein